MELEEKLREIVGNLSHRFLEGEISDKDYSRIIKNELVSKGILENYSNEDLCDGPEKLGRMIPILNKKLGVKEQRGLMHDYSFVDSTSISSEATRDIARYEQLKEDVVIYLKENIGEKEISSKEFTKLISDFVIQKAPAAADLDDSRRAGISGNFIGTFQGYFNIKDEEGMKFGEYSIDELEEVFERI